jgi:hexosaminidase
LQPARSFAGAQANLWSETLRRDSLVDYMLFPRLLAFAERAWHAAPWEVPYRPGVSYSYGDGKIDMAALTSDWNRFASAMPDQLRALGRAGIFYRIAPPGGRIVNGLLEANSEFPSQTIEYRANGGQWLRYERPVPVSGRVELRTRSFDGRRTSRTVLLNVR